MSDLCVVHLVRRRNGLEPLARFLGAYRECPGGIAHDLVLLCKGFSSDAQLRPHLQLARDLPHRILRVGDLGLDLWAYFQAARQLESTYLCFLNSYSRPLDAQWLRKLWTPARGEHIGAVGATGSFESFHARQLQLDTSMRDKAALGKLAHIWKALRAERGPGIVRRRLLSVLLRVLGMHDPIRDYPPFPNPHLRTNAFIISRDKMLRLHGAKVFSKHAAVRFESGGDSMTRQLLRMGKQVLIVGRDGRAYPPELWPTSRTFRLDDQSNLLVADNQTDAFERADDATRRMLATYAWGDSTTEVAVSGSRSAPSGPDRV